MTSLSRVLVKAGIAALVLSGSVLFCQSTNGQQVASVENKMVPSGDRTTAPQKTDDGVVVDDSYRIGIEDELQVSVWKEPELSQQVVVRPDGVITLPLLNDVPVVGLSTKQLQDQLTEKLKPFVTEPQVTIIVRAIRSRKVYLVGQVARPGAFPLNDQKTILQMLAEAGGLGPFAKADSIYVLRRGPNGKQEKLPFSYKKALKGDGAKRDFALQPGDMIVVP